MKTVSFSVVLDKIVGGGQALGTLENGKKAFVWGGLPGETVTFDVSKKKSKYVEGVVTRVNEPAKVRTEPRDPSSYLSTSPWQIMSFDAEQHYKAALIEEAFELHNIVLPEPITVYTDGVEYSYRNKVEFSWYGDTVDDIETLDLAFFKRGSKGKIKVTNMSLARPEIMQLALQIRDYLQSQHVSARSLKTLLIRCDQAGNCVWQLYVKDNIKPINAETADTFHAQGGEVIYSDPKSPASKITKRLNSFGNVSLINSILNIPFNYVAESFFQVNVPVYEQTLTDMKSYIPPSKPVLDMYSGVGTIGLTIGGEGVTMVETNEEAVSEMRRNIHALGVEASAVLAPSEKALEYITADRTIILDPPRAGLHADVIDRLLEIKPERIIYLSCNPVTQARDVSLLAESYGIRHHKGYNFFPRTPHIEHLVILDLK